MKIQVGNVHISAGRAQTAAPVLCLFTSVINGDDTHTSAVQTWGTFFFKCSKEKHRNEETQQTKKVFKISMIEKSWNTSSCSNSLRGWGRVEMKNKRWPGAWAFNFYIWCHHSVNLTASMDSLWSSRKKMRLKINKRNLFLFFIWSWNKKIISHLK